MSISSRPVFYSRVPSPATEQERANARNTNILDSEGELSALVVRYAEHAEQLTHSNEITRCFHGNTAKICIEPLSGEVPRSYKLAMRFLEL